MLEKKWPVTILVLAIMGILACFVTAQNLHDYTIAINLCLVFCIALAAILYLLGNLPGARDIYENLQRAGIVNAAGEAPVPLKKYHESGNVRVLHFWSRGCPPSVWIKLKENIETALNITLVSAEEGQSKDQVMVKYVPGSIVLPRMIPWSEEYISDSQNEFVLGESVVGPVILDLERTPHVLVGGITGSGKTRLLELIVEQAVNKGFYTLIGDYKGVDYGIFKGYLHIAHDNDNLLEFVQYAWDELNYRRKLIAESGCRNLTEYNAQGWNVHPMLLVIDEASVVFDMTGRSKAEKETAAKILGKLLDLTRLGRFAGIHCIIATQRPDVLSVPGPLKINLGFRICGRMADSISSSVILDDGTATALPSIPGRFLLRDGSGNDTIFQSYLLKKTP